VKLNPEIVFSLVVMSDHNWVAVHRNLSKNTHSVYRPKKNLINFLKMQKFFVHTDARTAHFKAMIKNLTEEREELKRKLNIFGEWVYFKHSFYYISSTTKSWQDSRNDCLQRGADLVIINSKEEQEFMRQFKQRTWIGLTDRETEGTWRWVDGTLLNTSYWASNEPNGHTILRDEDCGEVMLHEIKDNWNDKACDDPNFWICEKKLPL
uniref:C-type lectin domain-containing protein n=1 Tax=Lates calcarifer TaxID=8187 RepID=A0A4W6EGD0_LATCA